MKGVASAAVLTRISHTLELPAPVGGETWGDVELCVPFVLGSTSNREPFSPSGFQLGEKSLP